MEYSTRTVPVKPGVWKLKLSVPATPFNKSFKKKTTLLQLLNCGTEIMTSLWHQVIGGSTSKVLHTYSIFNYAFILSDEGY